MKTQSMIEYLRDIRKFLNHRQVPVTKVIELLGRQRPSAIPTGAVVLPHEKRVSQIVIRYDMRRQECLKLVSFDHADHPIGLDELSAEFGTYQCEYDEAENATLLVCSGFEEPEVLDRVIHRIDGYHFKNSDKAGLILVQPEGETFVPFADMQMPSTAFFFKEFDRPIDPKAKPRSSNIQMRK